VETVLSEFQGCSCTVLVKLPEADYLAFLPFSAFTAARHKRHCPEGMKHSTDHGLVELLAPFGGMARTRGKTPTLAVRWREVYRQQNKPEIQEPSVSLQALEQRKRKGSNLLSQFPQSLSLFVPVLSVLLHFLTSPHPQLSTLALASRTIHFMISTHRQ